MKIYLVCMDHEYEGIQDILEVFSVKTKAEEYIEDYNKNDSIKADRGDELKKLRNEHYFAELAKQGIFPGTKECINYSLDKACEIDEVFENTLSEYDQECLSYFRKSDTETLIIMEKELK